LSEDRKAELLVDYAKLRERERNCTGDRLELIIERVRIRTELKKYNPEGLWRHI